LGEELNLDSICDDGFDAVFVGMGLPEASGVSDERLDGLYNALEFLAGAKGAGKLDVAGKSVAVIGGGNTAMDVATTAVQLGARDVYLMYRRSFKEMPAWSAERDRAMDRGVHFIILTQPLGYTSKSGKLTGIKVCPTRLGEPDESGRCRPVPIESSTYDLEMDVVVEAIGQKSPEDLEKLLSGVAVANGLIETQGDSLATSREGVFAGGDLVRGASTVVSAVADGMRAARQMCEFMRG
jgi:NADPH-dependent glutamate synthase beta subunit-like oxidoreductase